MDEGSDEERSNCVTNVANKLVRKLRGPSQAHLVECNDGERWVVKSPGNPRGALGLAKEYIALRLHSCVGVATPEIGLVHITQTFLDENPNFFVLSADGKKKRYAGLHLGSKHAAKQTSVWDLFPPSLFRKISNRESFVQAVAVDEWTSLTESAQVVVFRPEVGQPDAYRALHISRAACLHADSHEPWSAERAPFYHDFRIYDDIRDWADLDPVIAAVEQFPERWLQDIQHGIVEEWLDGGREQIAHEMERLAGRIAGTRARLERLVQKVHPFRNLAGYPSLAVKKTGRSVAFQPGKPDVKGVAAGG